MRGSGSGIEGRGFNSNKLVRGQLLTTTMVADVLDCLSLHPRRAHVQTSLSVLPPRSRSCPSTGPAVEDAAAAEEDGAQVSPVDCRAGVVVGTEDCHRGVIEVANEGLDEITAGHEEGHDEVVGGGLVGIVVILDGDVIGVVGGVEGGHDGVVDDGPEVIQFEDHVGIEEDDGDAEVKVDEAVAVGGWSPLGLGVAVVVVDDLFEIQVELFVPKPKFLPFLVNTQHKTWHLF